MKREELLAKNKDIIATVGKHIKKYVPKSIVIVVTNPLDVMSYVMLKETKFAKERVFGMAGDLDAARFAGLVALRLNERRSSISTIVMGSHGQTMVPVVSQAKVAGSPLDRLLPKEELDKLVQAAKNRGAEIVSLLGQGSAYYAPSACVANLIESVVTNRKRVHCVSTLLSGEYGLDEVCIGVPAIIGSNGIEEILEIDLSAEEKKAFRHSAGTIKGNIDLIKDKE